jgi:hypothetical protein
MNKTVAQLPSVSVADIDYFVAGRDDGGANKVSFEMVNDEIKRELGYYKNPLKKCVHCGQWGAVMCECVKCGAPIDP